MSSRKHQLHSWMKVTHLNSIKFLSSSKATVYRVSWFGAKSRHKRWKEELSIASHEMIWIMLWFQNRVGLWKSHMLSTSQNGFHGLTAYAFRQAYHFQHLKDEALSRFSSANKDLSMVFGYESIKHSITLLTST